MGDWTTLSIREQTADDFNRIKKEAAETQGAGNYSADAFINVLLSVWTDDDIMTENGSECAVSPETIEEISEQLDRIESAQANTVTEALETAENADMDTDEILGRIDDLEARLPRKVAEEVHR